MQPHEECPEWEYRNFPNYQRVLKESTVRVLERLTPGQIDIKTEILDTRPTHELLFEQLVPERFEYYAGHYRGEDFECLRDAVIGVQDDARVGTHPNRVLSEMDKLSQFLDRFVDAIEGKVSQFSDTRARIYYLVEQSCVVADFFLRIHPYRNGNGHIARFMVQSILRSFRLVPTSWPVDPRPSDPPYGNLVLRFRNGERRPLVRYIMRSLIAD